MSMPKNVPIASRKRSTLQSRNFKVKKMTSKAILSRWFASEVREKRSATTITLSSQHTLPIFPHVIMSGFTMFVLSGCLSATLSRRMELSVCVVSKISIINASKANVLSARRISVVHQLNAKIHNAVSTIIQSARERKRFIWSS
jgi:hypothetical protein